MQALILCGGFGTRLRAVVPERPKALAEVAGRPFLALLISHLASIGVRRVVLATGYKGDAIRACCGTGDAFGIDIEYSHEIAPLDTAGAIRLAQPFLERRFLVLNGDTYVVPDLEEMREISDATLAPVVIAVRPAAGALRYGTLVLGERGRVLEFSEKSWARPGTYNSAGAYLVRRELLEQIPPSTRVSLEREVLPALVPDHLYASVVKGDFIDIGTPEDYHRAQSVLSSALLATVVDARATSSDRDDRHG